MSNSSYENVVTKIKADDIEFWSWNNKQVQIRNNALNDLYFTVQLDKILNGYYLTGLRDGSFLTISLFAIVSLIIIMIQKC